MLRAACEACRAIWLLVNAFEFLSCKDNARPFPLYSLRSHPLLQLDISGCGKGSLSETDLAAIVDGVTKAFIRSKAIQIAMYYCLHQRVEPTLSAAVQVLILLSLEISFLILFCM